MQYTHCFLLFAVEIEKIRDNRFLPNLNKLARPTKLKLS